MDKYALLAVLNAPFVLYGIIRAFFSYYKKVIKLGGLLTRMVFWFVILFGLLFAEGIYNYLLSHDLTDSAPLSIADVIQITGIIFCLFLILRLYSKHDATEQQLVKLHQELSIRLSENTNSKSE